MGTRERRQREKADLKAQILAAARRIVVEEGYAALTMRKLAQAVEYAPATIYLYFNDRDDIARQLAALGLGELHARLQKEMTARDPARRLVQFSRAYVAFALASPDTYRLLFMDNPHFATGTMEGAEGAGRQALAMLAAAIDELRGRRPGARDHQGMRLAEALWAAVHGVVSLKLVSPHFPAVAARDWADTVTLTLLAGMTAAPSRR